MFIFVIFIFIFNHYRPPHRASLIMFTVVDSTIDLFPEGDHGGNTVSVRISPIDGDAEPATTITRSDGKARIIISDSLLDDSIGDAHVDALILGDCLARAADACFRRWTNERPDVQWFLRAIARIRRSTREQRRALSDGSTFSAAIGTKHWPAPGCTQLLDALMRTAQRMLDSDEGSAQPLGVQVHRLMTYEPRSPGNVEYDWVCRYHCIDFPAGRVFWDSEEEHPRVRATFIQVSPS